jgi:hypothetical protein
VEDLEAGNVLTAVDYEYTVGGVVAFQAGTLKHVLLGVILAVRGAEAVLQIQKWKVPKGDAYGPLARRVWSRQPDPEIDIKMELCVPVELDEHNVLTQESIERILAAGLPAGR